MLRVFTPLGHARIHFPQSMHLETSPFIGLVIPRFTIIKTFRGLKSVKDAAEHVAEQVPH